MRGMEEIKECVASDIGGEFQEEREEQQWMKGEMA